MVDLGYEQNLVAVMLKDHGLEGYSTSDPTGV
jgi:hypothetical protein